MSLEPWIVAPLAITVIVYARGLHELLKRSTRARHSITRDAVYFASGFAVLAIALISPLHDLSEELFSAHMIQHELMMTVAAPLIVLGHPSSLLMWGLPEKTRNRAGWLFRLKVSPLAAFLLHGAAIWIWHAPLFYDLSVQNEAVHALQHLSFFGTALIFWQSMLYVTSRRGSGAILYIFLTAVHTTLLGALLTFSDSAIYASYSDATTQVWRLTAVEDVQLGGLIMWIPGGIAYLVTALYLMLNWLKRPLAGIVQRDYIAG